MFFCQWLMATTIFGQWPWDEQQSNFNLRAFASDMFRLLFCLTILWKRHYGEEKHFSLPFASSVCLLLCPIKSRSRPSLVLKSRESWVELNFHCCGWIFGWFGQTSQLSWVRHPSDWDLFDTIINRQEAKRKEKLSHSKLDQFQKLLSTLATWTQEQGQQSPVWKITILWHWY